MTAANLVTPGQHHQASTHHVLRGRGGQREGHQGGGMGIKLTALEVVIDLCRRLYSGRQHQLGTVSVREPNLRVLCFQLM